MAKNQAYYLKNPREQSFYRNLLMWLAVLGLAHMPWWGYERPNKIVQFLSRLFPPMVPLAVLSEMAYVFANRNGLTFKTLGVIFTIFPVTCIILVNTISSFLKSYRNLMLKFMEKISLHNFKQEGFVDDEAIIQVEKIIRYTSYFLILCTMIDWISWVFYPLITNIIYIEEIRNKTIPLNVFIYFWAPYFEYNYNVRNWIILHSIEAVLGWVGCSIIATFTCIVYIFVYHFIGHIKVLKEMIKYKFQEATKDNEMSRNLVDVIKYHIFIKNLFKELESAFGLNVTATYIHNLIGDSLLLYQVMFGEKEALISYGLMFFLYMGSLILLSFVLEEIKIQSDDLSIILYDIPWEDMSVRNLKTFLLLFSQVQTQLQFRGAGNLEAGVKPMISIIKSTFSYYVMLKSSVK